MEDNFEIYILMRKNVFDIIKKLNDIVYISLPHISYKAFGHFHNMPPNLSAFID